MPWNTRSRSPRTTTSSSARAARRTTGHAIWKGRVHLHGPARAGKDWAPPPPPNAPDVSSEIKDKECPNCGTLNAQRAVLQHLQRLADRHARNAPQLGLQHAAGRQHLQNRAPGAGGYPPPRRRWAAHTAASGGMPVAFDPMGGVNPGEPIAEKRHLRRREQARPAEFRLLYGGVQEHEHV